MYTPYEPDPERFRPLSTTAYVLFGLLFMIPILGQIAAVILTCLAKNINLRLYARAWLIFAAILIVALAALAIILYSGGKLDLFLRNLPEAWKLLFP